MQVLELRQKTINNVSGFGIVRQCSKEKHAEYFLFFFRSSNGKIFIVIIARKIINYMVCNERDATQS